MQPLLVAMVYSFVCMETTYERWTMTRSRLSDNLKNASAQLKDPAPIVFA